MSNKKFTQEPWEISDMSGVDAMDNYTVCFHIGVSSTGEMIADIQSDNKADYERIRANAYLMKAAPVMYDALITLVGNCRPGWQEVNVSRESIDKAINALKQARGEV